MSTRVLVVAPHPDDETLGCGGTLLRHASKGDELHWVTVTEMQERFGFPADRVARRHAEIEVVGKAYGFTSVQSLGFPPAHLDQVPEGELVTSLGRVVRETQANVIYAPYGGDVHGDHSAVFSAVASCAKWFRYPAVSRVLCYETLSETDFALDPDRAGFRPNTFVDIAAFLERKLSIVKLYESELHDFPFPRSEVAIRALAQLRGAASGRMAAEAFIMLRDIIT